MAEGIFVPSKNPDFPYAMLIKHIGLIKDKDVESDKMNENEKVEENS